MDRFVQPRSPLTFAGRSGLLCVAVLLLAISPFSHAVVITTSSGSTTNFFDNFDSVGQLTAPGNTDADPIGGSPGSWTITEDASGSNINVIASVASPDPGPFEGVNYLRIREPVSSSSRTRAVFDSLQTSGTVRADWMMYIPTNGISAISTIAFFPTTGDSLDSQAIAVLHVPLGANSFVNYRTTSNTWLTLNSVGNGGVVPYTAAVWEQWTFEVNLDTDLFRVGVENTFSSWLPNRNIGNVGALRFTAGAFGAGRFYFLDAVPAAIPEPSTALLLGVAAALCFRARRCGR